MHKEIFNIREVQFHLESMNTNYKQIKKPKKIFTSLAAKTHLAKNQIHTIPNLKLTTKRKTLNNKLLKTAIKTSLLVNIKNISPIEKSKIEI